ncbi:MAG TPA: mycofactocin system transcriptional regulator [Solirubrobacteraceae bacterium]|nr:mycofactocin system transcriptional regulator [Solirubrobacteraceae bacterium]
MSAPVASRVRPARGRPPSTSRDQVARTALTLFVAQGFEATTLADIAAAVGIGRRTLFRYFASKNDMVWGDFEGVLERLRARLASARRGERMMDTLGRAVVESNHYEGDALEDLRLRMTLITGVPALQAHSMVRYAEWRQVVSEFVAERLGQRSDDLVPIMVGQMALGASMAAFMRWVRHPDENLESHLRDAYRHLARGFDETGNGAG